MPYDPEIKKHIDVLYPEKTGLTSKNMFGGACYLVHGNMAFGIYKDFLIVRLGSVEKAEHAIDEGHAKPFDITGRAMKGWVMVPKSVLLSSSDYTNWLAQGLAFAESLPSK